MELLGFHFYWGSDDAVVLSLVGVALIACLLVIALIFRNASNGAKKFILFHKKPFPSSRCVWLLRELDIDPDTVEIVEYDPYGADEDACLKFRQEFNPHNLVPVLLCQDNESISTESGAICLYLAEYFKRLKPTNAKWLQAYYQWIAYSGTTADTAVQLFHELFLPGDESATPNEERINILSAVVLDMCYVFERHMIGAGPFICGYEFTAADVCMGYSLFPLTMIDDGEILKKYPRTEEYISRLMKRPAFYESVGTEDEWKSAIVMPKKDGEQNEASPKNNTLKQRNKKNDAESPQK